jgi:uncharacterized protein RhaS with RHS repeats
MRFMAGNWLRRQYRRRPSGSTAGGIAKCTAGDHDGWIEQRVTADGTGGSVAGCAAGDAAKLNCRPGGKSGQRTPQPLD